MMSFEHFRLGRGNSEQLLQRIYSYPAFVLLLLAHAFPALAQLEQVPPLSGGTEYYEQYYPQQTVRSDPTQACQAYANILESGSPGNRVTIKSVSDAGLYSGTMHYYVCTIQFPHGGTTMVQNRNILPWIPMRNPVCPYIFPPYSYNPASNKCERQAPCLPPNFFNPAGQCEAPKTYKLTLKPKSATIEPGETLTLSAIVTDQDGNPPVPPVTIPITAKVEVAAKSGGHDGAHSSPRHTGDVSPATANNAMNIIFSSPSISGTHTITATCGQCTNGPLHSTVTVKVDGLQPIPAYPLYVLIGKTSHHSENHFLTPTAISALRNLAASYRFETKFRQLKKQRFRRFGTLPPAWIPTQSLHVNDASLEWGGKFDIHGRWEGDHRGHRRGVVVDIRANEINRDNGAVPLEMFGKFQDMAEYYGSEAQVHCSDDKKGRKEPDCIGNDGSQDINRHFHILLLGVDQ